MQTASRLAIYALLELAANPQSQISASEIGAKFRVSSHHLAKVLLTLGRAGLVQSSRGVGGGYSFTGNARRLTLLEIISHFEDTSNTCKLNNPTVATPEEWALFEISREINDISLATYSSITLATMLKQVERVQRLLDERSEPELQD
jgi:Rrf2 family protein